MKLICEIYAEEEFQKDIKTIDAVIRNIEIIGEAATNLSAEFRARNLQVEWRQIIAARNQIIHGYASVSLEIIWSITQDDLPKLKTQIRKILEEELKK